MVMAAAEVDRAFETDIPARMDRLPWSRWHWLVITALGITWIIDGLEVIIGVSSFFGSQRDVGSGDRFGGHHTQLWGGVR